MSTAEKLPYDLRELARHLDKLSAASRSHGGGGMTYDDEVKLLRAVAVRDSGEEDSFEDAILAALA